MPVGNRITDIHDVLSEQIDCLTRVLLNISTGPTPSLPHLVSDAPISVQHTTVFVPPDPAEM